jgi:glycosyltransferase involved in cell wall biosynthesis
MVLGIRGIPNVPGGIETHAEQLYPRLAALGCEVEILVRAPYVARDVRAFGAVRLRRLWSTRWQGIETLVHSFIGVLYAGIARPEVLHVHAIGPALVAPIARLLGLKVVVTHHGSDYEREKWGRVARWVLRAGERTGMRQADARIVISQTIARLIRELYGLDSYLIPNGVVTSSPSRPSQHLHSLGLEPGKYFLHVGRMVREKRQLDLIAAYASKRLQWKLVLVGALDGSDYARQVADTAGTEGLVLTGIQSGEPLKQLYAHAGAFVLPSSHEGLPIALLEALSYGLPVVASDIPANVEIGLEQTSYYPLGDLRALADALSRLENAPPDPEARRRRIDWTAARYNWDRIAEKTLEVYRLVLKPSRARSTPHSLEG